MPRLLIRNTRKSVKSIFSNAGRWPRTSGSHSDLQCIILTLQTASCRSRNFLQQAIIMLYFSGRVCYDIADVQPATTEHLLKRWKDVLPLRYGWLWKSFTKVTYPLGSRAVMRWGSSPHARTMISWQTAKGLVCQFLYTECKNSLRRSDFTAVFLFIGGNFNEYDSKKWSNYSNPIK